MSIKETIKVLSNELACVMRQTGPSCDRNCAACDLVLPDEIVISAYQTAINILRAQQKAEKNEPLTLDEVRELGREPVYIVSLGEDFDDGWQLCAGVEGGYAHFLMFYHLLHLNHYGKTWLAYRRSPAGGTA